ncbi:UDP-glucose:undecaprenyl-phosphate glucose-1-phosphate transferase [Poriferisphaera corsica]|uniref:UDP-glucose:undecaprenyl-phosphate glucose-1-phosphate transferase n=1 Tax=Poriferisphaera corsica TaxID=2528020 RepID=A0A517YZ00_9BACT|nr:undecaprenyl-phosphate galactose phosphotransferase WbaP [Poriferisphaera corsica]QDU35446.1 UDP-glucose:undecaprenyl-phosphate glucose-1-phosphate transferase [Poriferisphaera corsica]
MSETTQTLENKSFTLPPPQHNPALTLSSSASPRLTILILILTDAFALLFAAILALIIRTPFQNGVSIPSYLPIVPIITLCIPAFALARLYPGIPLTPARELRTITLTISLFALTLAALTFLLKEGPTYSRAMLLLSWMFAIILVPFARAMTRSIFSHRPFWGSPAVIIGSGTTARTLLRSLIHRPEIGLKPIAIMRSPYSFSARSIFQTIPVITDLSPAINNPKLLRRATAVIAFADFDSDQYEKILNITSQNFRSTILLPAIQHHASLWVTTTDIDGQLSLKIRHHLINPAKRLTKNILETILILIITPILFPIFSLICILIKLDSKGPIFFFQTRIGKHGLPFQMIKFRTMQTDSHHRLEEYLNLNPSKRIEWNRTHKLQHDPRITRIGRFLRKTSLDELPQLINVILSDMAIVGPRPIFPKDVKRYQADFDTYTLVRPGITGMWQTHGRNTLTYPERVQLDLYYVRNWSIWLDLHILIKTIPTVLFGKGAY